MRCLALALLVLCLLTGCTNTEWTTEHRGKLVDIGVGNDGGQMGSTVRFQDGSIILLSGSNTKSCPWMVGQE